MSVPPELKVISSQYPVISGVKADRQSSLITDTLITDYFSLTGYHHEVKTFFSWTRGAGTNEL
jgi:hypothetical protein